MNSRHIIYVPKTAKDMKYDWFGDETADTYEWNLSDCEFNALWDCGVFEYLNEKLDAMIDAFEEEVIFYQKLYFYYEELIEELNKFNCRHEVKILIKMIHMTIKSRTYIGFFL